ncbi:MAG: GntR family transcriptional regulator [Acidimicrobiales bacterium]|nr:GntR family transcriptional regulator [Acidimicrobiales bacterium]
MRGRPSAQAAANLVTPVSARLSSYLSREPAHGRTTDDVTRALREAVLDGVIPPSTWLRESDLAAALGVSRTPIREALLRLADDGLVERVANRGSIVKAMTPEEVLAVYYVRESLEGLAARAAALRGHPDLVARLEQIHAAMAECSSDGASSALAEMNLAFHRAIRESSADNPYLHRFLVQVEQAVRRFGRSTYDSMERREQGLAEHAAIIDAIAAGDAERAQAVAARHMRKAREARMLMFIESSDPVQG